MSGTIKDALAARLKQAMKEGDGVAKEVLRVALGDIQTAEHRGTSKASDDEAAGVLRRIIKANEETLALVTSDDERARLRREIDVLGELLPKSLSVDDIVAALASHHDAIRSAPNDGAATGVAMKALKSQGANANGKDVSAAVRTIRGG
jgi:uncharacterized protein YqeY